MTDEDKRALIRMLYLELKQGNGRQLAEDIELLLEGPFGQELTESDKAFFTDLIHALIEHSE